MRGSHANRIAICPSRRYVMRLVSLHPLVELMFVFLLGPVRFRPDSLGIAPVMTAPLVVVLFLLQLLMLLLLLLLLLLLPFLFYCCW